MLPLAIPDCYLPSKMQNRFCLLLRQPSFLQSPPSYMLPRCQNSCSPTWCARYTLFTERRSAAALLAASSPPLLSSLRLLPHRPEPRCPVGRAGRRRMPIAGDRPARFARTPWGPGDLTARPPLTAERASKVSDFRRRAGPPPPAGERLNLRSPSPRCAPPPLLPLPAALLLAPIYIHEATYPRCICEGPSESQVFRQRTRRAAPPPPPPPWSLARKDCDGWVPWPR